MRLIIQRIDLMDSVSITSYGDCNFFTVTLTRRSEAKLPVSEAVTPGVFENRKNVGIQSSAARKVLYQTLGTSPV